MDISHSTQLPPLEKDIYSTKGDSHMKGRDLGKSSTDNIIS